MMVLNGQNKTRASAKLHQGRIHTKATSTKDFMQARQGGMISAVGLAEGFMVLPDDSFSNSL